MRDISKVIIHCSDSEFGDAELITAWHWERGFKTIGYHFVILNGCREKGIYIPDDDGRIETGRPVAMIGAHCEGHNDDSLGICLIGKHHFTANQLLVALPNLKRKLAKEYGLGVNTCSGHYEFNPGKTCPNMNMDLIRNLLTKL